MRENRLTTDWWLGIAIVILISVAITGAYHYAAWTDRKHYRDKV